MKVDVFRVRQGKPVRKYTARKFVFAQLSNPVRFIVDQRRSILYLVTDTAAPSRYGIVWT